LASAPASTDRPRIRQPNQLTPDQRQFHLVEVENCEDIRPENQLEAAKQQHQNLVQRLQRNGAAASITLHTILLGVGGTLYIPHTLDPLKKLGLDSHKVNKLGL